MLSRIPSLILPAFLIVLVSFGVAEGQAQSSRLKVGILLFEGVQIIDFTGPYEVFGQAGMEVWTATVDGKPISTHMKLRVTPTYALAEAPRADILVLPGGNVPHRLAGDDPRIAWVKECVGTATAVLSVCNGVFYLTSAGLLDGQRATTYALMLDHLRMSAPNVEVVADERVVDNGKIVTAGGLSAGIDGALHLVARYRGEARARLVANNMEYDWRPDRKYNRGALADVHIQNVIDFFPPANRRVDEVYDGDENHWELRWSIVWPKSVEDMRVQFSEFADHAGWRLADGSQAVDWNGSAWAFEDADHRAWRANVTIISENEGEILLAVIVDRSQSKR